MNFLKNNIVPLVNIAFFAWIFFFGNFGNGRTSKAPDTVYHVRTQFEQQPTQTVPAYQPIVIESKQPVVIPQQYQIPPATDTAALKDFIGSILKQFLAENRYADSTILRDSAGNNVGVYRNNDLVTQNMIKLRSPSYTLRFPHTIETRTITKEAEIRRQLSVGPEINGSQFQLVREVGFGAIYMDKKQRLYRFSAKVSIPGAQPSFEAGKYFTIHLGR